jgi:small subunit ribosomal protein S2
MAMPTLMELAEAGAHYGHHRSLTFPKARGFIFTVKNNIALINLEKTQECLATAQNVMNQYRADGKTILFVGTKRSIRNSVQEVAESIGAAYITDRWYGGFLTNFPNFLQQIKKMNELEEYLKGDEAAKLEKKERLVKERKLAHYQRFLGGVAKLTAMPDLLVLASSSEDKVAILEANRMNVSIIALTDTDLNPDLITYPIPANDDAPKAVDLILKALISASAPTVKKDRGNGRRCNRR